MDKFMESLKEYTGNFSPIGFVRMAIDIILVLIVLFLIYRIIRKKIRPIRVVILLIVYGGLFLISIIFNLIIFKTILSIIGFWSIGIFVVLYSQEIRYMLENVFSSSKRNNNFSSKEEKEETIKTIVSAVDYMASRNIGALITFEREDSLNNIIEKAISIDSNISEEIITTIFTPGTACHDGGMIIRSNKIICAGAYYPTTDKYDVPKSLGTRHRAAIGLSERYDAFTIVVSEESGKVSVTMSGVIDVGITLERLQEMLDRYLLNK